MKPESLVKLRIGLAIGSAGVAAVILIFWGGPVLFTDPGSLPYNTRPYNELTRGALDLVSINRRVYFNSDC